MRCERCGTIFCWDDADVGALAGNRRRYCSETCRVKAQPSTKAGMRRRRLREKQVASCRSRGKECYPDIDAALVVTARIFRKTGTEMYPYECACGWWHLSKQQMTNDHLLKT